MPKGNNKQLEHRLTKLETNYLNIQSQLNDIKSQVSNHLPSQMAKMEHDLNQKIDTNEECSDKKFDSIKTWLIGLLGGIIATLILLVINLAVGK